MAKKEKDKTRKSGAGKFFLGTFIGFILCLALLAGVGTFAYFKVSVKWINNTFKTEIDLGNEELNGKTIKEFINGAINLGQNVDTYTLNNLKADFGIDVGDKLMGIDITDLKDVAFNKLPEAMEDKLSNISADELKDVLDTSDMDNIIEKNVTYYVSGSRLYKDESHNTKAGFEYKVKVEDGVTKVIVKDVEFIAEDGEVEITLKYLPLTNAISDYIDTLGENLTLKELKDDFGVALPDYMNKIDENTTINELGDAIDNLYLADMLGYTIDDTDPENIIVKDGGSDVTGIIYDIAIEKVSNLGNITDKLGNLSAVDLEGIMDLSSMDKILNKTKTFDVNGTTLYENGSEVEFDYEVVGNTVTVEGKSFTIDTVNYKVDVDLRCLPLADAVSSFVDNIGDNLTIQELETDYGVVFPSYFNSMDKSVSINNLGSAIEDVELASFLGYVVDGSNVYEDTNGNGIVDSGEEQVTGIMAKLAKVLVKNAGNIKSTVIDTATIAEVMGYYYNAGDGKYYTDPAFNTPVTGIMRVAAGKKVNELSSIVDELYLTDVFSAGELTGVLSLIDNPSTVKVKNIASTLQGLMETSTIAVLDAKGVIDVDDATLAKSITIGTYMGNMLGDLTLSQAITAFAEMLDEIP